MKQSKIYIIIIIILIMIVLGMGVYIIYDRSLSNNSKKEPSVTPTEQDKNNEDNNINEQDNKKTYNVNDYISMTDFKYDEDCNDCGTVKKIEFKNLPLRLITEFSDKHSDFIYPSASETGKLSNEVIYEVDNNIFSILEKDMRDYANWPQQKTYDYYSLNIDLDKQKIITNQELLEMYSINPSSMYEKILENIANTVSIDNFLLDTHGNVEAEKISINEFKNNIKTYSKYIDNRFDVITLYLNDNNIYAIYYQWKILNILGMGTHMGNGLVLDPQVVKIN